MKLFLDAHISGPRIARALREAGHDVRAADEERELDGLTDEELLSIAAAEERVFITFDVKDFPLIARRWAEAGRAHAGCAIAVGIDHGEFGAILETIAAALSARPRQADWTDLTLFLARLPPQTPSATSKTESTKTRRGRRTEPMPVWAVLQHVPYEGPGLIAARTHAHGLQLDRRHLYRGDAVPRLDELAGLVVLGGPMGVGDTEQHPHLAGEIDLLAAAVAADVPVLGVCLGAQLLACALGGEVGPSGATEVGLGSVTLTPAGERDDILGPSGREIPVLHWHEDTFTIPPGAELLASSNQCVNQAFRLGRAYGLQFHVELDTALAASMQPQLPADVALPAVDVVNVERTGSAILGRFFDAALPEHRAPGI